MKAIPIDDTPWYKKITLAQVVSTLMLCTCEMMLFRSSLLTHPVLWALTAAQLHQQLFVSAAHAITVVLSTSHLAGHVQCMHQLYSNVSAEQVWSAEMCLEVDTSNFESAWCLNMDASM